jgi:hypothetical protein
MRTATRFTSVTPKQIDSWAPQISETDTDFYESVGAGDLTDAVAYTKRIARNFLAARSPRPHASAFSLFSRTYRVGGSPT